MSWLPPKLVCTYIAVALTSSPTPEQLLTLPAESRNLSWHIDFSWEFFLLAHISNTTHSFTPNAWACSGAYTTPDWSVTQSIADCIYVTRALLFSLKGGICYGFSMIWLDKDAWHAWHRPTSQHSATIHLFYHHQVHHIGLVPNTPIAFPSVLVDHEYQKN